MTMQAIPSSVHSDQCKSPTRPCNNSLDDSTGSRNSHEFLTDESNNQVQRRVQFSDMEDQVYFFEKAALKDYPCLWYGCHELQRMIDESRLAEKETESSTS